MDVGLMLYRDERETAVNLIRKFWKAHNDYDQTAEEAMEDLKAWTGTGHRLYLIRYGDAVVGLVHLGSRGGEIDWLEDIFVLPEYQGQGIGSRVIQLVEAEVKQYSDSLYIEAAARNERAIRLYRRLGYDCLNTITVRKDFGKQAFEILRREEILGQTFEIKRIQND